MRTHQPDQAVFTAALPEDNDREPFPAFPPLARPAVVVGKPSDPRSVRRPVPSGVKRMPHRHREDRACMVISGVFSIGAGEQFDRPGRRPTEEMSPFQVKQEAWYSVLMPPAVDHQ